MKQSILRENNDYSCHYYMLVEKTGKLKKNRNTACWAAIQTPSYWGLRDRKDLPKEIYIDFNWGKQIVGYNNIKLFVNILNKITPCTIVSINDKEYIKYTFVKEGDYYSNLLLLNYIRMIWNVPANFNHANFWFTMQYFDERKIGAFSFLMTVLAYNVTKQLDYMYGGLYGDHSNVYLGIVPKTLTHFKATKLESVMSYLQLKK